MIDPYSWIGSRRFADYLAAANQDQEAALHLYEWNAAVSASFFAMMSYLEVALRNALDTAMRPVEPPDTAVIDQRHAWWFNNPAILAARELHHFEAAERTLHYRSPPPGREKYLATLTFGFWKDLFGKDYEQLFRHHLAFAFQNRSGLQRREVFRRLEAIRLLRNRIAHHQHIFDMALEETFEQIIDVLTWLAPDLAAWVRSVERVTILLSARPAAASEVAVIIPARDAWPFYRAQAAYVCQPQRYFQRTSHVGFYADGAVQPEIAKIQERIPTLDFTTSSMAALFRSRDARDQRLAAVIREARTQGWTDDEYQVFLLTRPGERGHMTLPHPIVQPRRGRGSAWVQRQRYATIPALVQATTVADLE